MVTTVYPSGGDTATSVSVDKISVTLANERNRGTANAYGVANGEWNYNLVTGATGDQTVTASAALVKFVRVGGTANLVTAVIVKDGATTVETLPAASTPGTQRDYDGIKFNSGIKINLATASDTILVIWRLQ